MFGWVLSEKRRGVVVRGRVWIREDRTPMVRRARRGRDMMVDYGDCVCLWCIVSSNECDGLSCDNKRD